MHQALHASGNEIDTPDGTMGNIELMSQTGVPISDYNRKSEIVIKSNQVLPAVSEPNLKSEAKDEMGGTTASTVTIANSCHMPVSAAAAAMTSTMAAAVVVVANAMAEAAKSARDTGDSKPSVAPEGSQEGSKTEEITLKPNRFGTAWNELFAQVASRPARMSSVSLNSNEHMLFCRICHDDANTEKLITPCHCAGTTSFVHRTCIEKWLGISNTTACEICKFPYLTQRKPRKFAEWLSHPTNPMDKRHLMGDVVCFFMLSPLAAVSIYLCMTGVLYYLKDDDKFQQSPDLEHDPRRPSPGPRWEAAGLICLITFLIVIYVIWCIISLRYHWRVWREWRRTHQVVHVVGLTEVEGPGLLRHRQQAAEQQPEIQQQTNREQHGNGSNSSNSLVPEPAIDMVADMVAPTTATTPIECPAAAVISINGTPGADNAGNSGSSKVKTSLCRQHADAEHTFRHEFEGASCYKCQTQMFFPDSNSNSNNKTSRSGPPRQDRKESEICKTGAIVDQSTLAGPTIAQHKKQSIKSADISKVTSPQKSQRSTIDLPGPSSRVM